MSDNGEQTRKESGKKDDNVTVLHPDKVKTPAEAPPPPDDGAEEPAALVSEDDGDLMPSSTEQRLAEVEAETEALRDKWMRAVAEMENVRRRAAREKEDASRYATTSFARDMLAVADNLRRAIESVNADARRESAALEGLLSGVEMTEKALLAVFERFGVTPIVAAGAPFNPHVHEAMFEVPDPTVPNGTVVQGWESGYMIHDRPLRPARVGVAKGGPKAEPPSAAQGDTPPGEPGADGAAGGRTSPYERSPDASGSQVDEKL